VSEFSARRETAIGLGTYAAYLLVRKLVVTDRGCGRAARNARRVRALEERLGIHAGPRLQRLLLPRRRLLALLNVSYVTLNVALTVGWLMVLFHRRDPQFHVHRRAVAFATLGALPVFAAFPCDPPRALDDFVDTVSEVIDLDSGLVVRLYNPIAAMPSIHMAFAVVTGVGMARAGRCRATRRLGLVYPAGVLGLVLGTANHYVLDGIAGSALALAALRLSSAVER
jgi:hypothetical protein